MHIDKNGKFVSNLNISDLRPTCIVSFWSVHYCHKKSEEFLTFPGDFLEMSYELNIKMKCPDSFTSARQGGDPRSF